jgi:hypothetical protein
MADFLFAARLFTIQNVHPNSAVSEKLIASIFMIPTYFTLASCLTYSSTLKMEAT